VERDTTGGNGLMWLCVKMPENMGNFDIGAYPCQSCPEHGDNNNANIAT